MGKFKKAKFDGKFVKERLMTITLRENLKVFEELKDKNNDVNAKGIDALRKRLFCSMESSLRSADQVYKEYSSAQALLDRLSERQIKRRGKLFNWFKKYVKRLETQEREYLIRKHGLKLNIPCLGEFLYDDNVYEKTLFTDVEIEQVEQVETEQDKPQKGKETPEKSIEDVKSAEVEEQSDISLLEKKGNLSEEKKEDKDDAKSTSKNKAEQFLKTALS